MKKILLCTILSFLCFDAGATTAFAALMRVGNSPEYLAHAANAWSSLAGSNIGIGNNLTIATRMNETFAADAVAFQDILSTIAYNESPLTVFEVRNHLSTAFGAISGPIDGRRTPNSDFLLVINGSFVASWSDYKAEENGDFNTQTTGVQINAKAYISEGWALGVGYTRLYTDTDDKRIYTDGISNSVTAFAQYLSSGGMFINLGANIGRINWSMDKQVSGVSAASNYDTDFYAAQATTGAKIGHNSMFVIPQFGVRYMCAVSGKHTDQAVQSFDKWKYSSFNVIGDIKLGTRFVMQELVYSPNFLIGGSYSLFGDTDDYIHATLVNGSAYDIPVETGASAALHAGVGVVLDGPGFSVDVGYKLNYRPDYIAHTGMARLKLAF